MNLIETDNVLDTLLDPVARCFTLTVARKIASLRIDPETETRINFLAEKCNEGELSEEERAEYEAYVEGLDVIGLLQAKAQAILNRTTPS